ncbi:N-acetylglucosamine-6-phosphate deacetylase [Paenibacillus glycanilyticus]|uniref:N-acetylglucosamine-6-phosphate deacetylase n=1 Tax=Paenibacillus glycanilyticus TaxID=126569 RepID=A0ABQ6GH33_9BACL|nr:N-acetylglucosamine-6-phosphate deacetylase [Paenibacillus glycanilyticus]GLX69575.1 N-acetylglucosamine-6-phosphate deacetylase [Paenibacillus glycanilyticus]
MDQHNKQDKQMLIRNVKIVLEDTVIEGSVLVKDSIIATIIEKNEDQAIEAEQVVDGEGAWLLPGFIDVHVHGGFGGDFMDANQESYDTITQFHASQGTTGMLATTVTASREAIEAVFQATSSYVQQAMPYAALLGVHLEGPFISPKWMGAQNPAFQTPPRLDWLKDWTTRYPGILKLLTLAPENEGAIDAIKWLSGQNVIVACGHTDATYEVMAQAADAGLTHAVHTYNAMRPLHHREPGTVGAVLTDDRIYAELIADGHHVHPGAIRLLARSKPADKLILITDAMSAAGRPDGLYDLGGLPVTVQGGVARLAEGNLAGSSLTMINAFRYMLEHSGLSVTDISRYASANPAKQLAMFDRTGSIAVGKQADLVLAAPDFSQVRSTWVNGRQVYKA